MQMNADKNFALLYRRLSAFIGGPKGLSVWDGEKVITETGLQSIGYVLMKRNTSNASAPMKEGIGDMA
jgi:hypothetical protein